MHRRADDSAPDSVAVEREDWAPAPSGSERCLAGFLHTLDLDVLMPAGLALEGRVAAPLSALDGGRSFACAPGPHAGERYMFTTLRAHLERGDIPAHLDNEMRLRPSYRHLASVVDEHIVSFVLSPAVRMRRCCAPCARASVRGPTSGASTPTTACLLPRRA